MSFFKQYSLYIKLALVALVGLYVWHLKAENANQAATIEQNNQLIGKQEERIANLTASIELAHKALDGYEADIAARDKAAKANRLRQNAIAAENTDLKQKLKELENAEPKVKDYFNTRIPDAVYRLYRQSTGDKDGSDNGPTAGGTNGGNANALHSRPDQQGFEPEQGRFGGSPGFMQQRQKRTARLA